MPDIQIKGRNGYFSLKNYDVLELTDGTVSLLFYSKRAGRSAPCSIQGTRDDVREFLADITRLVR